MEAAGVRRGVGSVEAALLPLHQLFARRTAAKPPAVAAAAVADDWSVMARLEKPGAMKRSRAAIRFNEPRSRGSRSLRGSRAVHCAIRQILKERHRGRVRTERPCARGAPHFFFRFRPGVPWLRAPSAAGSSAFAALQLAILHSSSHTGRVLHAGALVLNGLSLRRPAGTRFGSIGVKWRQQRPLPAGPSPGWAGTGPLVHRHTRAHL